MLFCSFDEKLVVKMRLRHLFSLHTCSLAAPTDGWLG
jgi:hypothetical protein